MCWTPQQTVWQNRLRTTAKNKSFLLFLTWTHLRMWDSPWRSKLQEQNPLTSRSVRLSVCLSIYLMSVCVFVHPSIHLSVFIALKVSPLAMVQEIKQVLMDREETCRRTCFSLQLNGVTLDNFTHLTSIPGLQEGSVLRVVEGKPRKFTALNHIVIIDQLSFHWKLHLIVNWLRSYILDIYTSDK